MPDAGAELFEVFGVEELAEGGILGLCDGVEDIGFDAGFRRSPDSSVDGEPNGDLCDPGAESLGVLELGEFPEGAEEDFLDDFVGFCGVAKPLSDCVVDAGLEHLCELTEGGAIAVLGLSDECGDIGCGLHDGGPFGEGEGGWRGRRFSIPTRDNPGLPGICLRHFDRIWKTV